ncbi:hypothetical protein K3181_13285 [Qipengyuania sp. YG27]|uniref:PIN domain-containing protein n=1 Tax=Qipengyuania mesophila TaxID=2867246 RepID=A0ABS7JXN2_9SPHN|nr:hypothetical protein [Qipengyuania mesophila]MBX7502415.1 hypothetical protein [Qipengyuania mesophila]
MIVAADASVILHLIDPDLPTRPDERGNPVSNCRARIEHLLDTMSKRGDVLVVPTPALAEMLTKGDDVGNDWLSVLHGKRAIRIAPFDEMAAVECAALARNRKQRRPTSGRDKSKFDEQIVAIAVVARAEEILSDDQDIRNLAPPSIAVRGIADLDLPPEAAQSDMFPDQD